MIGALLWDVDGTLAETERHGHLVAFNQAFAALGIPWRWSESRYGQLLAVAGGRERLLHDMQSQAEAPLQTGERERLAAAAHRLKNEYYGAIVRSGRLPLRPGVAPLLDECAAAGVPLGIASTTTRSNVEALLRAHLGEDWSLRFATVMCAEDAPDKKPDPCVYRLALAALGVPAAAAVAIEDAPAGIEAARRAAIPVVVTRSHYFPHSPAAGALAAGPTLGCVQGWHPSAQPGEARITLAQIARWHASRRAARELPAR
jgi:HAD superfamily hydrolase (TIGR01509 family)